MLTVMISRFPNAYFNVQRIDFHQHFIRIRLRIKVSFNVKTSIWQSLQLLLFKFDFHITAQKYSILEFMALRDFVYLLSVTAGEP